MRLRKNKCEEQVGVRRKKTSKLEKREEQCGELIKKGAKLSFYSFVPRAGIEPAHPKVSRFSSGRVYQFTLISFFID
jgi:hypothetical protein